MDHTLSWSSALGLLVCTHACPFFPSDSDVHCGQKSFSSDNFRLGEWVTGIIRKKEDASKMRCGENKNGLERPKYLPDLYLGVC